MGTFWGVFLLASYIIGASAEESSVIVDSLLGKLEGTTFLSRAGREYYAFRGVPFAEKTERFQVSQLSKPWTGVKKATQFGNVCPQFDIFEKVFTGDEDCLFLNIYTPINKSDLVENGKKLPVMVWFNPGGFTFGKADFDPKFFMDEDIVLVTFNYRMGAFGFLDTGDDAISGNLGLKDQVVALQWVQKTISSFGGDSSKVTIFGCSAGGASVHYHMLSPMSKGLFRNAISQSGSVLAHWAIQRDPAGTSKFIGEDLKCPTATSHELVDCLKTKTVQELLQAHLNGVKWFMLPFNILAPSVESKNSKQPLFLESDPLSLITNGEFHRVPWIYGFTEDEGAQLSTSIIMSETHLSEINEDWSRVMPIALGYDFIADKEVRDNVSRKLLTQYFGNEEISEETWASFTHLFSDRFFIHPAEKAARLQAQFTDIYPFEFTFPGEEDSPLLKNFYGISGEYGVGHTDELQYQFSGAYGAVEHVDQHKHEVYEFSQNFVKLWASFATDNKPTSTWKNEMQWKPIPRDVGDAPIQYYQIAGKTSSVNNPGRHERMQFWDKLNVDNVDMKITPKIHNKIEL